MNARSAARELALLTLYQLDRQGKSTLPETSVPDLVLAAVRSLTIEAQEQVKAAADDLAAVSRHIIEVELNDPDNIESGIDTPVKPVPIPTTQETVEQIETCLQAAEQIYNAARLPELLALANQDDVQSYVNQLIQLVLTHQNDLDKTIDTHADEWRVERMIKIDQFILRLAAAEIVHVENLDPAVAINEAVELAKHYSTPESYKFINGLLGALTEAVTGMSLQGHQQEHLHDTPEKSHLGQLPHV